MQIQIRDPKTLTLYPISGMEKFESGRIFKTNTWYGIEYFTQLRYILYSTVQNGMRKQKNVFKKFD
jgi:hypothetical protein